MHVNTGRDAQRTRVRRQHEAQHPTRRPLPAAPEWPARQQARRGIAARRSAQQAVSPRPFWRQYGGITLTVFAAGLTALMAPASVRVSLPTSLLFLAVVYTIATGELLAGVTSVAIAVGYEIYRFVAHVDVLHEALMNVVALLLVVSATSAIVLLRRRRADLAWEERDRLAREQAGAQAHTQALESANRRMDEFLSLASHELRSPLAGIKLAIQLADRKLMRAARDPGDASVVGMPEAGADESPLVAAHELLATANAQVGRLDRLVRDLLDVSRIQAGKLEIAPQPGDLVELVREVVEEYALMASDRSLLAELPDERVMACFDDDRIREVVENLLNNALRYAPAERPITVAVRCTPGEAVVSVRDEGPGLAPEAQERIWQRFQRAAQGSGAHAGEATGGGGLGLGLYLSREIVLRHEGRIGVVSAPGKGATFWFSLQRLPAGAADGARRGPAGVATISPPSPAPPLCAAPSR